MNTALATATRIEAVLFDRDEHLEAVLDVLVRVRATDAAYPPADAGNTRESLRAWLLEGPVHGRWTVLADGTAAGHIMTSPPHDYLLRSLADFGYTSKATEGIMEIGRFFTDPEKRGLGLGSELFTAACEAAEETGHQPALAVLDGSRAARVFYAGNGMQELGSFVGVHGLNHVLVRDPAAIRESRLAAMRRGLYSLLS